MDIPEMSGVESHPFMDMANGEVCVIGAGWHMADERLWKAHQFHTLTRTHAKLMLTHAAESFEVYATIPPSDRPPNACSDEVVPISALIAGLRAEGYPVEGDWNELSEWNILNKCPVLAAWPGPANCTLPSKPSWLPASVLPYLSPFADHAADPWEFHDITLQHLRNLLCSNFMFARKFPADSEVINGTEHIPFGQVALSELWMEAESGPCM